MAEFAFVLMLAGLVVAAIINIAFAIGVHADAQKRLSSRTLLFVSPFIWTLATLFGGVFVATAYWVMHLSSLTKETGRLAHERPNPALQPTRVGADPQPSADSPGG